MCHTWVSFAHLVLGNHGHLCEMSWALRSFLARLFSVHAWLSSIIFWTDFPDFPNLPVSDLLCSSLPWYSTLFLDRICPYPLFVRLPVAEFHCWTLFPAVDYLFYLSPWIIHSAESCVYWTCRACSKWVSLSFLPCLLVVAGFCSSVLHLGPESEPWHAPSSTVPACISLSNLHFLISDTSLTLLIFQHTRYCCWTFKTLDYV